MFFDKFYKTTKNDFENFKPFKNCSVYYYSGSIPVKNKYIIDSLFQNKSLTSSSFKLGNISDRYKKINELAKNLKLINTPNQSSQKKSKSFFSNQFLNNSNRDYLYNYYIKQNSFCKKDFYKTCKKPWNFGEKRTVKDLRRLYFNKIIREKFFDRNVNFKSERINQANNTFFKYGMNETEFLYKKIFFYNPERKNCKLTNYIDNKLNIFYSENESQYNARLKKLNDLLNKEGKKIKHKVISEKTKYDMPGLIKKVKLMKRIVDYVYPNMVLAKVKEESKRVSKTKSLDKIPLSRLVLLKKKEIQNDIDVYLGQSLNLLK